MLDTLVKGDLRKAWDIWADDDAIKFITDGSSRDLHGFMTSGVVAAGQALGELRARLNSWDFLGGRILDVGCGIGRHCAWFHQAFKGGAIGVDASPKMIAAAKKYLRQIEFLLAEEDALPLPDASVNVVFSFTVLQHNPRSNVRALLAEMARVLCPGGVTVIQLPIVSDPQKVAYPTTANRTAVWLDTEFAEAIAGHFLPIRVAVNSHFGFHVLQKAA